MDFDAEKLLQSIASYGQSMPAQTSQTAEAHRRLASQQTPVAKLLKKEDAPTLAAHLSKVEEEQKLPPRILHGVAITETGGERDPLKARSAADAQGLFQQREIFRKEYGIEDSHNPLTAAEGTAKALQSLKKRFGSWELALAAYNWGPGNVRRYGMENAPQETKDYVANVMAVMQNQKPLRSPGAAFKAIMNKPITEWRKNGTVGG